MILLCEEAVFEKWTQFQNTVLQLLWVAVGRRRLVKRKPAASEEGVLDIGYARIDKAVKLNTGQLYRAIVSCSSG